MDVSPRLRFQENKAFTSAHKELVTTDQFRAATEAALVQFLLSLPDDPSTEGSAANWHRVEGARAFLRTLMNIAESAPLPPSKPNQNLTR